MKKMNIYNYSKTDNNVDFQSENNNKIDQLNDQLSQSRSR